MYDAVDRYQREMGAAAGRGTYRSAMDADRIVQKARRGIAKLIGAHQSEQIIFTLNCTDALNLALHGGITSDNVVITSEVEHNSVLRPLRAIQEGLRIEVMFVRCDEMGLIHLDHLEQLLQRYGSSAFVALSHVSNVSGAIQPLSEMIRLNCEYGATLLVDAAQSAGTIAIDVAGSPNLMLAASGHKGLLGPLGTGFLYLSPGMENRIAPLRQGGTGTKSDEDTQPIGMPERYESGNLNMPGLAGLAAGVEYLLNEGVGSIATAERELIDCLHRGLLQLPGVRTYGPRLGVSRAGLLAFTIEDFDSREIASLLDASFEIEVRAGLHCAPLIHRRWNTPPGGTVRASVGHATKPAEIEALLGAIREVVASR